MTARFLATIAAEMQALAVAWQIYGITHRALDLGLVGLAQFLPGVFLFLIDGQTADHFPRRRILQCCYLAFAGISTRFGFMGRPPGVWPVYGVAANGGGVSLRPASQAFLRWWCRRGVPECGRVVERGAGRDDRGADDGGLIYGLAGSPAPVYACSMAACLTAMGLVGAIRIQAVQRPRGIVRPGVVLDGLRYLWRAKLTLGAISLDMFAVLLGGAVALLPVYAKDFLKVGGTGLGILRWAHRERGGGWPSCWRTGC